ncbi:tetratricopeptide repeat protein [Pseudarthrobacter oxydans]|uniref:tetratricopeptide repeat protein n=1 Tax=Pseudarthrobacter oxydans TaxID=1671 RepID=UPI00343D021E
MLLSGPPGVGKTQLAASVFQDPAMGVDLRLWVRAESRTSVVAAFAEAADRVQVPVPDDADDDKKVAAFLNWLSTTERIWLVVFDNVSDPAQLAGLWPTGPGRVLITTYRQDAALVIGNGVSQVRLGVFTPEEAQGYIERRIQDATRNGLHTASNVLDEADGLANDLGFLPVALAQAVSVVLYQVIRCSDYRVDFAHRANSLSELFPERLPADEYERTVATTWSLAMEQANTHLPNGLASRMVQLAAATNPAGAPEAVFLAEPSLAFLSAASQPSSPESEVSAAQVRSALRDLHSLSLLEHQPIPLAIVRMHTLTQRAVNESTTASMSETAVLALADSLSVIWPAQQRENLASLLANTEHLIAEFDDVLWKDGAHDVLFTAGISMLETGMVAAAIRHFEWLSKLSRDRLGHLHPDTVVGRSDLARAYKDAGKLAEAIEVLRQLEADYKRQLTQTNNADFLRVQGNLATCYQELGQTSTAIPMLENIAKVLPNLLGKNHPDVIATRNNLAAAFLRSGQSERAVPLLEGILKEQEDRLGKEEPTVIDARNNLAGALLGSGAVAQAVELFEQSVADESVRGSAHPRSLAARSNLGHAYLKSGMIRSAVRLLRNVLEDMENFLGSDHPSTLNTRNTLAGAYFTLGDVNHGIRLMEDNLKRQEEVLGKKHPNTLGTRHNLAGAHLTKQHVALAVKLFTQSLADMEEVFGEGHPRCAEERKNLAYAKSLLGPSGIV